ncbi:uncharacterized protein LOC128993122 [Macrosteles quadrilineatus]|uniref:uncharacterized protein LOC128993122 n=1 Tax=Macrosteles quadrilineatus TaxID=74068 RepID=UPI0023E1D70F|nr:uncharacterized protein LOC128993122 [Macrosteles quadrilineatus]
MLLLTLCLTIGVTTIPEVLCFKKFPTATKPPPPPPAPPLIVFDQPQRSQAEAPATAPQTFAQAPQTFAQAPQTFAQAPQTFSQSAPQTFAQAPQSFAQAPQTFAQAPQTNAQAAPAPQITPQARFEYFELIAPNQNGQNYNPTLTISNPDYNVVYRPQNSAQPQRPQSQRPQAQRPQPQRPQRPPQRPQVPQRPGTPPLYQFPKQPGRPNSQVLSRPTVTRPRNDVFPAPGHRFGPQAFSRQPA